MKKGLAKKVTSVLLASAMVFSLLRVEARRRTRRHPPLRRLPGYQAEAKADDAEAPEAAEGKTYSIIYLTPSTRPSSGLMWALGLRTP